MLLTITNTHSPATDLGYLLYKNPSQFQSFDLSFGKVHVFYPEATSERCTVAMLLDVDPIDLIRNKKRSSANFSLDQYVNDRPYVASSFMSVAISRIFGTALSAKNKGRPDLVEKKLPLETQISVIPCRKGKEFLKNLFEPLGYSVDVQSYNLDEKFKEWGESLYFTLKIKGEVRLSELLSHLYVLIPVLDDDKHYWVNEEEVEKLLRFGEGWLSTHPLKDEITKRYLKHQRDLTRFALSKLLDEDNVHPDQAERSHASEEEKLEAKISLNEQRLKSVVDAIKNCNGKRIIDLGCGEGKLIRMLLEDKFWDEIVGMDVSWSALQTANRRLNLERLPPKLKERITLIQGSLIYRDSRLKGYDVATVIEVIEHLDAPRLKTFERILFEYTSPKAIIVTTPNIEYNVKFERLPFGQFRHRDHRFEWTREEFKNWADSNAKQFNYSVTFQSIGEEDSQLGSPTQMAIFSK